MTTVQTSLERLAPAIASLAVLLSAQPSWSQITPDTTLPVNSIVTPNGHLLNITGGTPAGSNLFHSFNQFSVLTGQTAYFNNPLTVQNIISRVTGSAVSNIDGLIQANGTANLFLVNPNGIIFGPNAALNIGGSFLATTAPALKFADGTTYSATAPANPLLTISLPIGVQWSTAPAAGITSQANLNVGGDLTLIAGNLELQNQLQAGGNLTLQALDTLKIRDSVTQPFIAMAGGDLLVQGNQAVDIFALNHANSGLYSGRDMVLRSANTVGGDAHYSAGGSFRIEQLDGSLGNLFSPYDPVIRASGDVSFTSYQGASLHILAGGSVNISGSINITGRDATGNALQELVTLSNNTTLPINGVAQPTLDIRAGTTAFGTPGLTGTGTFAPGAPAINAGATGANITIGGGIRLPTVTGATGLTGALVYLTNQYQPVAGRTGSITVNGPNTFNASAIASQGGTVVIDSSGSVNINGRILTGTSNTQNGGNVTLLANGNIGLQANRIASIDIIDTATRSFNGRLNAGNLLVQSGGTITVDSGGAANANIVARSASGNGGTVEFSAGSSVLFNNVTLATNVTRGTGNAGPVTITGGDLVSFNGGQLSTTAQSGNGGAVTISGRQVNLDNQFQLTSSTLATGNSNGQGGSVTIRGDDGVTLNNSSNIRTNVPRTGQGQGGSIEVISSRGSVTFSNSSQLFVNTLGVANAGSINVQAGQTVFLTTGSSLNSQAEAFAIGDGGNVTITAGDFVLDSGGKVTSSTLGSGDAGDITVNVRNQFSAIAANSGLFAQTASGSSGSGGKVTVTAGDFLLANGGQVTSSTAGSGDAGDINVYVVNQFKLTDAGSGLFANTAPGSTGNGGNIFVDPISVVIQNGAGISVGSQGSGVGGNIQLFGGSLFLNNGGFLSAQTASTQGGNISVNFRDLIVMRGGSFISTTAGTANAGGNGGNINIDTGFLVTFPNDNADITANAFTGNGGNINITAQGIFGFVFPDSATPFSDITASSQFGVNGVIAINTPGVDPTQGVTELPSGLVDASRLIAKGCDATAPVAQGSLVITGRGGLPPTPNDVQIGDAVWEDMRQSRELAAVNPSQPLPAQGWVFNDKGEVMLTAQMPVKVCGSETTARMRDEGGNI